MLIIYFLTDIPILVQYVKHIQLYTIYAGFSNY